MDRSDDGLKLKTLSELLLEFPHSEAGFVYLQSNHPWKLDSLGLIYSSDRYEENTLEVQHPEFYQSHHLYRVMSVYDAQDVIRNAQAQKKGLLMDELLACFNHFAEYGGFLDFKRL